jgi:hypothetical protein
MSAMREQAEPQPVEIDSVRGVVRVHGIAIDRDAPASALDGHWARENCSPLMAANRRVDCLFASRRLDTDQTWIDISLRYENQKLVSIFIALEPPAYRALSDDAFYNSVDERVDLHARWLRKRLGHGFESAVFSLRLDWGVVGVARDKSENVYIYLHYRDFAEVG